MTWIENIDRWRQLPAETKLRLRWEAIPDDVARSMTFAGEPVPIGTLRAAFARIPCPAAIKPKQEPILAANHPLSNPMPPEPTRADLARELLLCKMREYSQDGFCASWMDGLEPELWQLAVSPPANEVAGFPPAFFIRIRQLALLADGWWVWEAATPPESSGPVFISLSEWERRREAR